MIGDLHVDSDVDVLTWAVTAARSLAAEVEFARRTGEGAASSTWVPRQGLAAPARPRDPA